MDEIRPITGWFTKNISKLSSLLMGTRGPPRGECVLPQLLPLCNKPRFEVLDQFSICCFIVHFARLIEEASGFLRRLDLNLRSFFIWEAAPPRDLVELKCQLRICLSSCVDYDLEFQNDGTSQI